MSYLNEETKEKFMPFVIETSAGADRTTLAFMLDAYDAIEGGRSTTTEAIKEVEIALHLHPKLAPIKFAILPLLKNKEELVKKAKEIYDNLKIDFNVQYDATGTIGKRYRRQDEVGTPYCITIDFDTLEDNTVTLRDRDSMEQKRINVEELYKIKI
jgi:glycyl-tRNA synthetase